MPSSPEDKKRALTRLHRIQGQCEALARALEAGSDCGPILQQIAAVRGGINGLMAEVLESHIREEFAAPTGEGKADDLLALVRRYLK
ncbi:regulator protein that represses frmRAB operon [Ketogulonicigenium robustum]|uniref:Regulator protein that represses frmRAB operon n=1 Tax=Ketogulonicigenium robustum TaxID=92947 RepID=A0A1W6NWY4_9RHOB|nr:metal/formaldehyde-sensitive transcriptional repressor [Ketogulonicigenium robustum]ARO13517.1 regulator protein that represses frmRAB operon [Ketogulonicigenium robustum]